MIINKDILDALSKKAKESPRLRANLEMPGDRRCQGTGQEMPGDRSVASI